MDLKGSLVDTNLKVYPSERLLEYLKDIPTTDDVPENILKLIKGDLYTSKEKNDVDTQKYDYEQHLNTTDIKNLDIIKDVLEKIAEDERAEAEVDMYYNVTSKKKHKSSKKPTKTKNKSTEICTDSKGDYLTVSDIDWLYTHLKVRRSKAENEADVPYLHVLLENVSIVLPENEVIKRNPELEARCVKLRAQQEARDYRKMTKFVDNVRMKFPEDSISYQLKQLNRQLIAIGQFIISIFAGFLFGFRGVEWMVGNLDFGVRLLLGVMCALIIALAEIYFLAKKLNEELNIPETTQLGGPPKFVNDPSQPRKLSSTAIDKEHQD